MLCGTLVPDLTLPVQTSAFIMREDEHSAHQYDTPKALSECSHDESSTTADGMGSACNHRIEALEERLREITTSFTSLSDSLGGRVTQLERESQFILQRVSESLNTPVSQPECESQISLRHVSDSLAERVGQLERESQMALQNVASNEHQLSDIAEKLSKQIDGLQVLRADFHEEQVAQVTMSGHMQEALKKCELMFWSNISSVPRFRRTSGRTSAPRFRRAPRR
jgi:archaellum component FlaC